MTDESVDIKAEDIEIKADELSDSFDEYVDIGPEKSCLDGDFTSEQLRTIADMMDEWAEEQICQLKTQE